MRVAVRWAALAALALLTTVTPAAAEAPGGPRLAFLLETALPDALVVGTSDSALEVQANVAGGGIHQAHPIPSLRSGPAWSPDGAMIAFSGFDSADTAATRFDGQLYTVAADGSGLRAVPRTQGGFSPVFSPNGRRIAFAKTLRFIVNSNNALPALWDGTTVWSVRVDGTGLRQLTEWENGVTDVPSSFSPDGSVLAMTHRDVFRDRADATALRLDSQSSYVLARSASWPRYSPDGGQIAFLGIRRIGDTSCCELGDGFSVDLYTMNADRSQRHRLTHTPAKSERPPSWDPSGQRLVYTTKGEPRRQASGDLEAGVMQINANGTCLSRVSVPVPRLGGIYAFFSFPTWQPGPGREAGRIAC